MEKLLNISNNIDLQISGIEDCIKLLTLFIGDLFDEIPKWDDTFTLINYVYRFDIYKALIDTIEEKLKSKKKELESINEELYQLHQQLKNK